MKRTRLLVILIGVLVILTASLVAQELSRERPSVMPLPDGQPGSNSMPSEDGWNEYENTSFMYRFAYPYSAVISKVEEMEPAELERSAYITVGIPGDSTLLQVLVWGEPDMLMSTTSLAEFAEMQHQWQTEDKNPSIKDKRVGVLEKIDFKGKEAYAFTLTGSFVGPWGGYSLPVGAVYRYIVVEHNGEKLILDYPIENRLSQKVIASFEFVGG